jgi:DNA polymerase-3 subunit epsilon
VAVSTPTLALVDQRFAVIDVETSGLSARRHRILQIGIVTVDGRGHIVDEWSSDVRPHLWRVGPRNVHGLTIRRLRRAPSLRSLVPELTNRLDGSVLVAHNAGFDWAFVSRGLRRAGYQPPDALRLCTLHLSRSLDPAMAASHRLADLCARHGVTLVHAHDALADARATAELLPHLLRASGAQALDELHVAVRGSSRSWPVAPETRPRRHRNGR